MKRQLALFCLAAMSVLPIEWAAAHGHICENEKYRLVLSRDIASRLLTLQVIVDGKQALVADRLFPLANAKAIVGIINQHSPFAGRGFALGNRITIKVTNYENGMVDVYLYRREQMDHNFVNDPRELRILRCPTIRALF